MCIISLSCSHFSNFYAESHFLLCRGKCIYSLFDSSTEKAQKATKAEKAQLSLLVHCPSNLFLCLGSKFCFFHPVVYMVSGLIPPGRNDLLLGMKPQRPR